LLAAGRVHPAVVSGFNEATKSVTVEWFENQETKVRARVFSALLAKTETHVGVRKQKMTTVSTEVENACRC
jgi:hypothetical protein